MARGKQIDNETVYKIMLSVFSTNNYSETARQLEMAESTVEDIYKRNIEKEEFAKLREQKKDEFVEKAGRIIDKALNRLEKVLDDDKANIAVNNLSTVIGTLFDKKNLAEGKSTVNTDITIKMDKKVEELSK